MGQKDCKSKNFVSTNHLGDENMVCFMNVAAEGAEKYD